MKFSSSLLLLGVYGGVRLFSFLFPPGNWLNAFIAILLTCFTLGLIALRDERGWVLVFAEFILGGSGNYLGAFSVSLRSLLLVGSLSVFGLDQLLRLRSFLHTHKSAFLAIGAILLTVFGAALQGALTGHATALVFGDMIPYLTLLYYFPLKNLLSSERFRSALLLCIPVAIVGNALFVGLTFAGFSNHYFILQDSYYHWFRDVANGKITDLGFNFFRIVLSEHLLLIPLTTWFVYTHIYERPYFSKRLSLVLTGLLLFILSINFTRIYLLALLVSLLLLFSRQIWRRWLAVCFCIFIGFVFLFTSLHLASSRGASLGWDLLGLRLQSIVSPSIEDSSLSRMLLLPEILKKITAHPLLGAGLGDSVTVYSPVLKQSITTPQFDWGYLELIDELGFLGFVIWPGMLLGIFYVHLKKRLPRWQLASLGALCVINLTSPALFHVLGVGWVTLLMALL